MEMLSFMEYLNSSSRYSNLYRIPLLAFWQTLANTTILKDLHWLPVRDRNIKLCFWPGKDWIWHLLTLLIFSLHIPLHAASGLQTNSYLQFHEPNLLYVIAHFLVLHQNCGTLYQLISVNLPLFIILSVDLQHFYLKLPLCQLKWTV